MYCPNCRAEMHCGCGSCRERSLAAGRVVTVFHGDDTESCGHCGHRLHVDQWMDEEGRQIEEEEAKQAEYER